MTGETDKGEKQERMVRIKMRSLLSPFCFPESVAMKKVEKMRAETDRRLKFELVPVDEWDPITVWKPTHPIFDLMMSDQMRMLRKMEDSWPT